MRACQIRPHGEIVSTLVCFAAELPYRRPIQIGRSLHLIRCDSRTCRGKVLTERILAKMRARDEAAFTELTRQYGASIYSLQCWLTGDPSLAEDLTQETFMALWRGISEFRAEASLRTWVHRIARNVALQHLRRPGVKTVPFADATDYTAKEDTAELAERAVLREIVRAALAELPQEQREAVVLNKLSGLSHREVARVMGRPLGTVKWHIAQALDKLHESLARKGVISNEV